MADPTEQKKAQENQEKGNANTPDPFVLNEAEVNEDAEDSGSDFILDVLRKKWDSITLQSKCGVHVIALIQTVIVFLCIQALIQ